MTRIKFRDFYHRMWYFALESKSGVATQSALSAIYGLSEQKVSRIVTAAHHQLRVQTSCTLVELQAALAAYLAKQRIMRMRAISDEEGTPESMYYSELCPEARNHMRPAPSWYGQPIYQIKD